MWRRSIASYYKCNEAEVIEAFYWLLRSQVYCHPELAPHSRKQTADTFLKKWQLHLFHDQKSIFISIKTRIQFSLHLTDVRPVRGMTFENDTSLRFLKYCTSATLVAACLRAARCPSSKRALPLHFENLPLHNTSCQISCKVSPTKTMGV